MKRGGHKKCIMVDMSTLRQKLVAQKITENGGKNLGKAMLAAGYASSTAKSPNKNLKSSKAWPELMQEHLTDIGDAETVEELRSAEHLEDRLFDKKLDDNQIEKIITSIKGCKVIVIWPERFAKRCYFTAPTLSYRSDGVDKSLKLKLRYPKEKSETEASEELKQAIAEMSKFMAEATQRRNQ